MNIIRWLFGFFRGHKSGYSIRGFWGVIKHYNKEGVQIGYSRKTFWGRTNRYDMDGNLVSYSRNNFWGGYNTYDAEGNLIRRSYKNIFGGFTTFDRNGKKIRESYKNFWEGLTHFDIESPDKYESVVFEKGKSSRRVVLSGDNETKQTISELKSPKKKQQLQDIPVPKEVKEEKTIKAEKVETPIHRDREYSFNTGRIEEERKNIGTNRNKEFHKKDTTFSQQKIVRDVTYYQCVEECIEKNKDIRQYAKILVFEYKGQKEFPALAYISGDMVRVMPLIHNEKEFEFSISELNRVRSTEVTGIDMNTIDNEFVAVGISSLAEEFEELLPDYQFGMDGMYRTQCELECGLIITEKSMDEMWDKLQKNRRKS